MEHCECSKSNFFYCSITISVILTNLSQLKFYLFLIDFMSNSLYHREKDSDATPFVLSDCETAHNAFYLLRTIIVQLKLRTEGGGALCILITLEVYRVLSWLRQQLWYFSHP